MDKNSFSVNGSRCLISYVNVVVLIIQIQNIIHNGFAATFVSLSGFLYSAFECCRVLWNSAKCHGMHWSSTNSIIVICIGYKYYVLEEDNNAIILASFPVRWNGITHCKLKLYINFISHRRYCIYQHCFLHEKNTTFMDNMYRKKYYVHGQHSINIVECNRVLWNSAECNGVH
jgi:hypothetical protein